MHFYLSIFWKDTKKDKNKYFSFLFLPWMMAMGRCTEGSLAKSITAKCSQQLLQTNYTRGLPSPAFKGNHSAVLKKKVFPVLHGAVIEGDMGEAHSYASCGQHRVQSRKNSDGLSAVLLGPRQRYIHQATFDLVIITYVCLFWTKIYIFIKNWSSNFNDFIYGLESGKGTDPIVTRRLRDRKIKFLRKSKV